VRALVPLEDRYAFEIVLVNDGSSDDSLERMKRFVEREPRLRIIELSRNYGQTAALQAGLDAAQGEILVTMDADLQHFPEEIPRFLEAIESGYDMVCGWRHERAEGVLRRWPSRAANVLIRLISGLGIHDFGTTFRAYRAELVKDMRLLGDFHRYIPMLGYAAGGRITEIPIRNVVRPAGRSHKLGLAAFAIGASILTVLIGYAYLTNIPTVRAYSGWFLTSIMLLLASVQIMLTGLLAEILVRVHYAQGDRRVYRVRREWHRERSPEPVETGRGRATVS